MISSPVSSYAGTPNDVYQNLSLKDTASQNNHSQNPSPTTGSSPASARLVTEYYSSDSLFMTYTNGDGDSVSLSMEHVEYQKAMMSVEGDSDSEQWKQIVDYIKKEFERLHGELINKFIESLTGEKAPEKTEESDEPADIPGLPEYWNAENTSQRIVDFAVSFYGMFEGTGSDYLETIRGAIDEGFSQARGILGELPGEVDKLVSDTYDLVMKKLDAWAEQQGITASQVETQDTMAAG